MIGFTVDKSKDVTVEILRRVRSGADDAVFAASVAGAKEAAAVVVNMGRVKTGRLRDGNKAKPATPTIVGAEGAFYNDVPYALYHEFGTRLIRPIRFMEIGGLAAARALRDAMKKLIGVA